jgi:hypothetical protein
VEIAQRYDLDRVYNGEISGWQSLEENERSEHRSRIGAFERQKFYKVPDLWFDWQFGGEGHEKGGRQNRPPFEAIFTRSARSSVPRAVQR